IGLGLLWMARSLEKAPPGTDDLAEGLRAGLSGWRSQLVTLTDCTSGPDTVLAFGPEGRTAWTLDSNRVVRQRSLKTGEPVSPPLPHGEVVKAAAVSGDGSLVLTATVSGARLWEVATGKPGATLSPPGKVYAAALSSDGRTVLTLTAEGKPSWG